MNRVCCSRFNHGGHMHLQGTCFKYQIYECICVQLWYEGVNILVHHD